MPNGLRLHLKNKMIGKKIEEYTIFKVLGEGNTAVTYEVKDKYQRLWAIKIVTRESYKDRAPIREIVRFAPAEDDRYLILPEDVGDYTLNYRNKNIRYKFIINNYQSKRRFKTNLNNFSSI